MQARVTCPACQTTLGVNPAHGDGTVLRCPKCRHEFAIRLRPQPAAPPSDPLGGLLQEMPPHPSCSAPLASRPARSVRPPGRLAPDNSGPSGSLLWIGIAGGAALAVAAIVLVAIVMHIASPANHRDEAGQNIAAGTPPAAQAPVAPAGETAVAAAAVPTTAATGQPVSSPAPASSQAVVSVSPNSPLPPRPAPAPAPAPPPAPILSYRFNAGEEYAYSFTVKADIAGNPDQSSGMCTLSLSREAAPAEFAASQQQGQGSGSGFVVTPDGYIVTCAHVVEGSTKLEAVLGTQTYPAQVVAFDKEHDLAVIHVIASNLATVSLANSDTVQLAEEVRAVGYPLSNLLGESVKITRGTIAGVVNTSGHKLFQVDASINPGNSGGPMVNEMGQVVGVASAKLAREDIDGVGFAVPASDVLALLRSKGISLAAAAPAQKLDGPSLAKRVTPAVAMIKVTIGPGGYGIANRLVLDFSGHVTTSGAPRTVGRIQMPGMPSTESDRGKLLLSERGELLDASGNVQLPFLLGRVSTLAIEPFAADDKRNWQTQRATVLTQIIGEPSNNPFSMRFRHRGRSPFAQSQTKVVVTPAIETASYDLSGMNGDLATITKRYTFQTLDPAGSPPTAKVTGEGTMTFNRAKGYAEKMEYKATFVRSVSNVSVTVPMTLEWHRLSQGELDQIKAKAQANLEAAKKAHEERMAQAAKKNIGEDTEFVGGSTGGGAKRTIDDNSLLYGLECGFGEWGREQCLKDVTPIFSRGQELKKPGGAVAREGYAVGAVNVHAGSYVNAIQLVFMRVKDGRLNPKDSYTSPWIGVRGKGTPRTLTGNGDPIIGISVRQGLVCDALALVINRKPKGD
jgi:serine protease Do